MNRILLYGATGYTGKLIAHEAARRLDAGQWGGELTLASRDENALRELARKLKMGCLPFALDQREPVVRILKGFDVLINAAGPFSSTASRLAKGALDAGRHYVDLNSEPEVYNAIDDLALFAARRALAMVCGGGWIATASDVLLDHALTKLKESAPVNPDLRTVRIALSPCPFISRGSAITVAHAIREQVGVVRDGKLTHVPIGQLEHAFDLATSAGSSRPCIASACNVPDTMTARRTTARHEFRVPDIESYVDLSGAKRFAYEIGALGAVAMHLPFAQRIIAAQFALLPEGPREEERKGLRNTVAIEIENTWRETVASWVLETANLYDFSACSALDISIKLAYWAQELPAELRGWVTPSAVLAHDQATPLAGKSFASPFSGSVLYNRLTREGRGSPNE